MQEVRDAVIVRRRPKSVRGRALSGQACDQDANQLPPMFGGTDSER